MRDRLAFPAVVVAALAVSGLLLLPRLRAAAARRAAEQVEIGDPTAPVDPEGHGGAPPAVDAAPPAPTPPPAYVHLDPASAQACPEGMALVDGVYCPFVGHRCLEYANEPEDVCTRYAPEALCEGRLQRRRFCIDLYEYPNLAGVRPAVMVDFADAKRACAAEDKRLCAAAEWEFACEGTQMWPYPYGLERDATACNIDRPHPEPDRPAFADPAKISDEVARLDQRVASGELGRCVSPFGVHDMTGNVDEWVDNPDGHADAPPYRSSLKGGYWGPVRDRCRPITTSHDASFRFYEVGFRCCADAKGGRRVVVEPEEGPGGPRKRKLESPH